jgi:glycosyltransferase involved in cell wall biosynthesis
MRLLYIFPGSRKAPDKAFPSSQLYGLDRLPSFGITPDSLSRDDALPQLYSSQFGKWIGFKMRHALLYFKTRSYDVVFGPALLYLMPFKKIFAGRAKYVMLNIELVRILRGTKNRPIRRWFIEALLKEFSGIVCLATSQKEWLVAHYPSLLGKVFVVPLSADITFFEPLYDGRRDVILSVGGDSGRDYGTLLETARLLPNTQFEIVCHPRNLADLETVPNNVHVSYDLAFSELKEKYRTARMIVIPTHSDESNRGADCSGQTVLLDAMASGLPIIVSRRAYLADYIREGEDAIVVDCYNPEQIANAIQKLTDEGVRMTLAKSARVRAEEHLSAEKMASDLTQIFNNYGTTDTRH